MDEQEKRGDNDEDNWWELWDRRRRMAVAQVVCLVAYAINICSLYYDSHCDESATSEESEEKKACAWERELESIKEAIKDFEEAIREANTIIKRGRERVYSEEEVFAELLKIGVDKHLQYAAYAFLVEDPGRVRAFFGYPFHERKDLLLQMMFGSEESC